MLKEGDMFGDCTVSRLIGRGGMASVWLVNDTEGRQYALKTMNPSLTQTHPKYKDRFIREALFAMGVRHRNLITVHDAGEDPERGVCYILMDYMPGGSLKEAIEKRGPYPVDEAIGIASQVAHALDAAHGRGIVHRDLKPDNILFDAAGVPKLADLGVAKFSGDEDTVLTMDGMILGTPAYMAPEQMMDSHKVDARADIYSLGIVLYEMLAGKRPNEGGTVMGLLAKAIRGESLPDVRSMRPEVSAAVAYVLSAMCSPRPEDRPKTPGVAADLLVRADSGHLLLPSEARAEPARGWWKRILFSGKAGK